MIKHGLSHHPLHNTWRKMKDRCYNPNNQYFHCYGGLGVEVCDRWRFSFPNFLEDMGEKPSGMTLDRIDVGKNYEPDNCRWATAKEQRYNQRCNQEYGAIEYS